MTDHRNKAAPNMPATREPTRPIFSKGGNFEGHRPRACGEHRTVGGRAWCYQCGEWCYPDDGCIRCRHPSG